MSIVLSARLALLSLVTLLVLVGTSFAQTAPSELPPEKVRQFLELLSNPEVKAWLEEKVPAAAPRAACRAACRRRSRTGRPLFVLAYRRSLTAIPRIPQELSTATGVVSRDVNSGRPGLVVSLLAILVAVGFGVEWLVRRALLRFRRTDAAADPRQATLLETAALSTFALASAGSFLAFAWPPLLGRVVLTFLLAFIAVRVVRTVVTLLFSFGGGAAPSDQPAAPVVESDALPRFWRRRVSVIAGFLLFGWAVVSLMPSLGFSIDVARLMALLCGLGMLAVAIEIVWRRPGRTTSVLSQSLLTLYLIALWLAWVAGLLGLLWLGLYALLLPAAVRGVGNVAQALAGGARRSGALGVVMNVLIVRGARAAVIAVAVAWLAYVWRIRAASLAAGETGAIVVSGLFNGIIVLLVADLIWQLSKALIAYRIELVPTQGATADELARSSRLRTLLPIFRNTLAALIAAIAILTILAGLGVQIAPLIAGAGIFGVAIGFGSQTLVKDVISGVFYMLDDAFRVGEYIQSGGYKGTVESFSLRSVRLRHHRGAVFTVPFGELGAVQNMSRDWVIDKMTINVTYRFRCRAGSKAHQEDRPGAGGRSGIRGRYAAAPEDAGRRQFRRLRDRPQDEADDKA